MNCRYFTLIDNSNLGFGINKILTYENPKFIFFQLFSLNDDNNVKNNKRQIKNISNNICIFINTTTKKFGKILKENICKHLLRIISYKLKLSKHKLTDNQNNYTIEITNKIINKNNIIAGKVFSIESTYNINRNNYLDNCNLHLNSISKISIKKIERIIEKVKFLFISENFLKEFDKRLYLNNKENYEKRYAKELFYKEIIQNSFLNIIFSNQISKNDIYDKVNFSKELFENFKDYNFAADETINIINDMFFQIKFFISKYF